MDHQNTSNQPRLESPDTDNKTEEGNSMLVEEEKLLKKQHHLEVLLSGFLDNLQEDAKIEKKISALKGIQQKIQQCKVYPQTIQSLCDWLMKSKLLDKYLHDNAHIQVLRKMPLIIKFLYENMRLNSSWISKFILSGLSAHEEYMKVVQFLVRFLRLEDLAMVFKLLRNHQFIDTPNFSHILLAMVNNKQFYEESSTHKQQKKGDNFLDEIYQEELTQKELKKPLLEENEEHENYEEDKVCSEIKILTLQLFQFMIELIESNLGLFVPILNKLISSKYNSLLETLVHTISQLFKSGKVCYLWILEHCLKIDVRQGSKDKSIKNPNKISFIHKLVNEGVYEYTIAVLARNRFQKVIVEKALGVLVLLSKNLKPLEKVYTEYIWKILGLNSRDEKEREQFFIFVRDSLRNDKSFTEEAVDYIYFQILMKMSYKWYSIKIFQCLQLLFMRLNEDLKYLSYTNQAYSICNPDLIGLQKFWYIYFYTTDVKVSKKSKEFLWKLATCFSNLDIKYQLYEKYLNRIIRCMAESSPEQKQDLTMRGFEIIEKLLQENQRKEKSSQYLQLTIRNQTQEALLPKNITINISEKACLSHLREQISLSINPSLNNIKLLLRGQFLKGEKMTLKELSIHSGQTIMVINQQLDAQTNKRQKQLVKQNQKQLLQIFGDEIEKELLMFIAEKMQGENIEKIMNSLMDETKMVVFREQFNEKSKEQEQSKPDNALAELIGQEDKMQMKFEDKKAIKDNQQLKFSILLSQEPQNIKMLLNCAQESNYSKGWETLKKIPVCTEIINQLQELIFQERWEVVFPAGHMQEIHCIYHCFILKNLLQTEDSIKKYMFERKGLSYLLSWLPQLLDNENSIFLQLVTDLIKISLYMCENIKLYRNREKQKKYTSQLLSQLIEETYMQLQNEEVEKLIALLRPQDISKIISLLIDPESVHRKCQSLVSNLGQIVMVYMTVEKKGCKVLLKLKSQQLINLLKLNGFLGQYIYLYAIAEQQKHKDVDREKLLLATLNQIQGDLFTTQGKQIQQNIIAYYDFVACLLVSINPKQEQIEQSIVVQGIEIICKKFNEISRNQFSGILQMMKICISSLYKISAIESTSLEDKLSQFGHWLFSQFLFCLLNPHRFIRQKDIRKYCYEILDILSNYQEGLMLLLCENIINIGIQPRPKEEDYIDFKKTEYLGLTNLGATCYINSLLQQVYHTKFSKLLLQDAEDNMMQEQNVKQTKILELKKVFMRLHCSIKNAVNPKSFINSISFYGEPINTSVQQDATQFLLCLFDYIESQGYNKEIYEVFGGNLCNQITAGDQNATFVKNNIEHFNSIGIDIKGKKNLQEALAYFIKSQNLDGQNMYYCEELGKKTKATKCTFIENMPNILLITLKRFQFDYETQSRSKLNDYFQFPFDLDMHKYSASYLRDKQEISDSKYRLSGVLVHSGSAESGHYYSFIKVGEKWYEFNDKYVSEFNIANIRNQCFGCAQGRKSHNAYMLFYEKVDSGYHGVYLNELPDSNEMERQIVQQNSEFLKNRLVYDENFINFVDRLYMKSMDERILTIKSTITGNKAGTQETVVHFNLNEDMEPWMSDQMKAGGKVDDFDEGDFFCPPQNPI